MHPNPGRALQVSMVVKWAKTEEQAEYKAIPE